MGMCISAAEHETLVESEEYRESLESWESLSREIRQRRELIAAAPEVQKGRHELLLADLHCVAVSNFLRPLHATEERYRELNA